jgi:hypothetical protein
VALTLESARIVDRMNTTALAVDQPVGVAFGIEPGRLSSKPIFGAAHRLHDIGPELLPKVADVDLDDIGARVAVVSPDLIEELGL